jgi:hypothetical protein
MSNVAINIAAEFTGKKAFDQAGKSAAGLTKQVKNLSKYIGSALLIQYGKEAVKAFADDQAAAQRLATAVSNLGYSFSQVQVSDFISNLERTSNILDDNLRPAFQSLLTTTGSLTQSQKLLNDAIQISRASGVDLATVASDLAQAYVGNTKGLKKYYTGLTQAELKTMSFSQILDVTLRNSAGAAEAYLGTTSYKLDVLTTASNNAKESIGAGLVDALAKISDGSTASDAAKAIDNIAKAVNALSLSIGTVVGGLVKLYKGLDYLTSFGGLTGANGSLANAFESKPSTGRSSSPAGTWKRIQQQKQAELDAIKRNRELARLAKQQADAAALALKKKQDQAALDKLALILGKGEDIFNMDAIQIQAALTAQTEQLGKVTNQTQLLAIANDLTRLRVKQDMAVLDKAIADGDVEAATAAAAKLNTDLKNLAVLQGQELKLSDINKILKSMVDTKLIDLANLDIALQKIKDMYALLNPKGGGNNNSPLSQDSTGFWNVGAGATVDQMVQAADLNTQFLLDMAAANEALIATLNANPINIPQSVLVQLNLTGGDDITKAIANNLQNNSLSSGNQAYINRRTGGFE